MPTKEEEVKEIKRKLNKLRTARHRIHNIEWKLSTRLIALTGWCGDWCAGVRCDSCESRP